MGLFGKHDSGKTAPAKDHVGKHRVKDSDLTAKTADIRVDRDDRGRVTGWGVGREIGSDDYER